MNILKAIALVVFMGFTTSIVMPEISEARPKHTETYKKKVKKKTYKKKYAKVRKNKRKQTTQTTQPRKVVAIAPTKNCFEYAGNSHAAFFACDQQRSNPTSVTTLNNSGNRNSTRPTKNVVAVASRYEGLHARKNRKKLTEILSKPFYNRIVDPTRIPWCAAFANAVLKEAGYSTTQSLLARSFLAYGAKTKSPAKGDIVVFRRGYGNVSGHVGFFMGYDPTSRYVMVLGGNQRKQVNVVYYPVSKVLGYRKIG